MRRTIVWARITPRTLPSFSTRTRRTPLSAMISATRSMPSFASTYTRDRVMISSRGTCAGFRATATTFARISHSVTMPIGRPSAEVTMTNPWCWSAMCFAASRRDVWGRNERNSASRMSFAYRTMQTKVPHQRPLCLYFARRRLGDRRASDGGGNCTEQTNPGNDAQELMERIHERTDFKLALGNRKSGENRLHHRQWHPGGHDCEREPEAHQEPHVEQGRRHARGDAAAHDRNGIHNRGHVGSDEQAASDPRENHREDEDRVRDLVRQGGEPNVRSGGDEQPARGEESGTVPVGEISTEGADAHKRKGERDQKKARSERVEPERPLEVEHEDEADGPSSGRCEEVAEDPRGKYSVPEEAQVHHRGPSRPLDRDEGDETRDSGEQHDDVEPGPA